MRKLILITIVAFIASVTYAQQGINYKALISDNGSKLQNQSVDVRFTILQDGGTTVYSETQTVSTDDNGIIILNIGEGTADAGVFADIDWSGEQSLKVEINTGTGYSDFGTTAFKAVPYALHAKTVENSDDADADASNELQTISLSGTELTLSDGGGTVTLPSTGGGGDNWGTQKVISDATLTGEGTTASPLSVDGDITDDQTLSVSGDQLSISEGNSVTLPTSSSPWTKSLSDVYIVDELVTIGENPYEKSATGVAIPAKFNVVTDEDRIAVKIDGYSSNTTLKVSNRTDPTAGYGKSAEFYGDMLVQGAGGNAALEAISWTSASAAKFRGKVIIDDGTQGDGKVLTSDADGNASWQTPAGGGGASAINDLSDAKYENQSLFLGAESGSSSEGAGNVGVGYGNLNANTTGYSNTAIGYQSLYKNTTTAGNVAVGMKSLYNNYATGNTAIGTNALNGNQNGNYNTALGNSAGYLASSGHRNIFIGYKAGYNESGSDKLYIENSDSNTPLIGGDFAANAVVINGTLEATGVITAKSNVDVKGKLTGPASGNADMKAYAYGEWTGADSRHLSENVNIAKGTSEGVTNVTVKDAGSDLDYIVVANIYAEIGFVRIKKGTETFQVTTYDIKGAVKILPYTFVVYKK